MIRDATPEDAAACVAIYAPYVRETAVTFETEPPDAAELAARIAAAQREHAWLVAERDGALLGYAYAGSFRGRRAYSAPPRRASTSLRRPPVRASGGRSTRPCSIGCATSATAPPWRG